MNTTFNLELVTHCWAGPDVPVYLDLLKLQLSSILKNDDPVSVITYIVCADNDEPTNLVADRFEQASTHLRIFRKLALPPSSVFRRAIGRNIRALNTQAEVIWFTDCDYLFGKDSLRVVSNLVELKSIAFPQFIYINKTHEYGDHLAKKFSQNNRVGVINYLSSEDWNSFVARQERKAIGGIQIIHSKFVKEEGYCNNTKWMRPVTDKEGFPNFRCDIAFRKQIGASHSVDIPNVYRVRHSRCGADKGTVDHGRKTRV